MAANTARFRTDLDKARQDASRAAGGIQGAFGGIGRSITSTIGSMLSLRNVIGTVLGTAGLGLLITKAINAGDAIAKMAERTGLTTDALQELQHAASLSGTSTEDLETGLRNLSRRLGEAATGEKAAVDLFRQLGITVTTSAGAIRDVDSVLGDFADKIAATASPAERTRLAMEAFGRSGTQLLPMLAEGRKGMAAMREEARALGLVLDSQMLKEAERANDAMDRLARVLSTTLTRAIVSVAPHIEQFANNLAAAVSLVTPLLDRLLAPERAGGHELLRRIQGITDEIERLKAVLPGLGDKVNELFGHDPKGDRQARITALEKERAALVALLETRNKADQAASRPALGEPIFDLKKSADALKDARRILDSLNPSLSEADRKVLALGKQFDELAEKAGPAAGQVQKIGEQAKATVLAVGQLDVWSKIVDDFAQGLPTWDAQGKAIDEIRRKYQQAAADGPPALRQATLDLGEVLVASIVQFDQEKKALDRLTQSWEDNARAARDFAALNEALTQSFTQFDDLFRQGDIDSAAAALAASVRRGAGGGAAFAAEEQSRIDALIASVAKLRAEWNAELAAVEAGGERFNELTSAIEKADTKLIDLGNSLRIRTKITIFEDLDEQIESIGKLKTAFGSAFDETAAKAKATEDAITALVKARIPLEDERVQALVKQNEILQQQVLIVHTVGDAINGAMNTAAATIVDAFIRGEGAAIKWGDVVKTILADIVRRLIQVFIIDAAIKALGGIAGSLGAGTNTMAVDPGGTKMQHGGIVTRPTHALIGEAGPEAVIPLDRLQTAGTSVEIKIIDQRKSGEIESRETGGSDGRRKVEILIKDTMKSAIGGGEFDKLLGISFGLGRKGAQR